MKINSINKTNFQGIYLAMGNKYARETLKQESKKYKNMMCLPVSSPEVDLVNKKVIRDSAHLHMKYYSQKPMLVVTGKDTKKYKDNIAGYNNTEALLKKTNFIMILPLFNSKSTLKKIAKDRFKEEEGHFVP